MSLIAVGTNHKICPIELREGLSFSKKRIKDVLLFLKERKVLKGAVILSTCNRVEIYVSTEDPKRGAGEIKDFISLYHEIDKQRFSPYLYIYEDKEALRHLISVACGLDSLILGETQILNQVKSYFLEAQNADFTDRFLNKVFSISISLAKEIHNKTLISEGNVSAGTLAIDFIKEKLGLLSDRSILIIGVGKVTELVLKYLKEERPKVVFLSNRTFEKAEELAAQIQAEAVRFDNLKQFIKEVDVVITATRSPHFIIKKDTLEGNINRKLLIIDLAVPRDVDPKVKEINGVELFCLEDLDSIIQKNVKKRRIEAEKAEAIIDIEVERQWSKFIELEREEALLP